MWFNTFNLKLVTSLSCYLLIVRNFPKILGLRLKFYVKRAWQRLVRAVFERGWLERRRQRGTGGRREEDWIIWWREEEDIEGVWCCIVFMLFAPCFFSFKLCASSEGLRVWPDIMEKKIEVNLKKKKKIVIALEILQILPKRERCAVRKLLKKVKDE